jgi:demethylmenaquinone methyltransferase/2-methoxy-6-polyprenyl-1,4-benzoquinol methylase
MLSKEELINLYRKRAKNYDITAKSYYLFGFREQSYRKRAIRSLNLRRGDTVVEICCGTGLNFSLLQSEVGPSGKIIGVDLTDSMLGQAKKRVKQEGWTNVELIQMDAAKYQFPQNVNGIISTFAITFIPEYDRIIKNGAEALSPSGRFVILDLMKPDKWPIWLLHIGVWATKPFGISLDLMVRHPWESINRYLANPMFTELYWGLAYISVGEAQPKKP